MICHVCQDTGWTGWTFNGERKPCQWCNADPAPAPLAKRNLRAERRAMVEAIVSETSCSASGGHRYVNGLCVWCDAEQPKQEAIVSDKPTWEKVRDSAPGDYLDRMKVPGGWLYRTVVFSENESIGAAMCFVPDALPEYHTR